MSTQLADPTYLGDLGDGLVCRWSTKADQERIGYLMGSVFRNSLAEPINVRTADEARIYMSDGFPFTGAGDFALIEDRSKPEWPLVACTCFWRHRWSYGGIEFGVGRPENVATEPAYRNRGLVRTMIKMIHARSAAEGHLVQAITGIPYFYRQFGYEYVLDLGGQRRVAIAALAGLKAEQAPAYTLRPATHDDIPNLLTWYNQPRPANLVWHETAADYWRYHIAAWEDPVVQKEGPTRVGLFGPIHIVVDPQGRDCGYTWLAVKRWSDDFRVYALELAPQVNWAAAMPGLLQLLHQYAETIPPVSDDTDPLRQISFHLGRTHPAYTVLGDNLAPRTIPPYAWYLRVPDVPAFLQHITPVLEERLAGSLLTGHTGELKIDCYRGGLRLAFAAGRLVTVEPWRAPAYDDDAQAGCPALVFLQLLFGYRSLSELRAIFPDIWASQEAALLLDVLFPKQPSTVYSLSYT
ncbi:MAG: GNAT family N-acetyltransferase [Caldilinea sp. CFX5]|nr:GNAT family N-acetyltransferase [Caldilinea sp. CFX5]